MTVLRIVTRQMSREMYRAIHTGAEINRDHPVGLILHGASKVEETMQITQVWDSEEYARRFDEERLRPALQAVGAPLQSTVRVYQLDHLVTP